MQKKIGLYFLAVLMLIITAFSASALNILETSVSVSGNHSTTVTGNFTVQNDGLSNITMVVLSKQDLSGADGIHNISAGPISFDTPTFSLNAGANKTVQFSIPIPSNQYAQVHHATFNASDVMMVSPADTVGIQLTVEPQYDFTINANTPSIVQGQTGKLNVTLTNTGNADITTAIYKFSDSFENAGTYMGYSEVSAGTVSIPYASTANLELTFNVVSSQLIGMYMGNVNITKGSLSKTQSLSVSVETLNRQISQSTLQIGTLAYNRLTGNVISASVLPFKFNITNTGNVDLTGITISKVALTSGSNTIDTSKLTATPDTITALNKGTSQLVTVSTTGLDSANLTAGTYTGAFVIDYGASSNQTHTVQFDVRDAVASLIFADITLPSGPRESVQNTSFTITNNGDYALTGISMYATDYPAGSSINMTGIPSSLAVGASSTVYLSAYVPADQSSGIKKLATLHFNSTELQKTANLNSNVTSKLQITKVKLTLASDSVTISSSGTTSSKKIKPNEEFEVEVTVENMFSDSEDVAIEDILIEGIFEEVGDDGDDIEGEAEEFDLDAGEDVKKTIDFDSNTIAYDVDEGTYTLEITVEGDDENGATQDDSWLIYVTVERENAVELDLDTVEISPATVSCFRTAQLVIQGSNLGTKDDSKSRLVITSDALGISKTYEFKIGDYSDDDCDAVSNPDDKCSEIDHTENLEIADSVSAGTYPIKVTWYYKTNQKGDEQTVNLKVDECGSSSSYTGTSSSGTSTSGTSGTSSSGSTGTYVSDGEESGTTQSDLDVQFASGGTLGYTPSSGQVYASSTPTKLTDTTKKGFTDSPAYLILLGSLNLLVIIVAISLIVAMGRRK